jgi:riboflavin transporter
MIAKPDMGRWLFYGATFVAASALGGLIKIPSPVGSIAFDSAPGYFVAAYIHPVLGGIVGCLGHIASAATAGFPLGHVHIWVAAEMFLWCLIFGYVARLRDTQWALVPAIVVAVILNGVVGPWVLGLVRVLDMAMVKVVIVILIVASLANVLIAALAVRLLASSSNRREPR